MLVLVVIITILAIIMLIAKLFLQVHLIKTVYDTTLITKSTENYGNKIRDSNNQLNYIEKIQQDAVVWSYLLEYIANNTNDDITFSQISLNKDQSLIRLNGLAKTREGLLLLKKIWENENYFTDINFPIKNILQKKNIKFQISVKLKSYEFEQL